MPKSNCVGELFGMRDSLRQAKGESYVFLDKIGEIIRKSSSDGFKNVT